MFNLVKQLQIIYLNKKYSPVQISRTFQDQPKNSRTFQAWKMVLWNSRTFQDFQDLYEPWNTYSCLLCWVLNKLTCSLKTRSACSSSSKRLNGILSSAPSKNSGSHHMRPSGITTTCWSNESSRCNHRNVVGQLLQNKVTTFLYIRTSYLLFV